MKITVNIQGIEEPEVNEVAELTGRALSGAVELKSKGTSYSTDNRDEPAEYGFSTDSHGQRVPDKRIPWATVVHDYQEVIAVALPLAGAALGKAAELLIKELVSYYGTAWKKKGDKTNRRQVEIYGPDGKIVSKVKIEGNDRKVESRDLLVKE
jgi:hypothetical protein